MVGIFWGASAYQSRDLLATSQAAPPFHVSDLRGEVYDLEALRGRRVILHFWATWCGVCRREFSMLNRLHQALTADTVLLAVVDPGDVGSGEALRRFVAEQGIHYPVVMADEAMLRRYRVRAFPTNYYLDARGRIESRTVGMSTGLAMRYRAGAAPGL